MTEPRRAGPGDVDAITAIVQSAYGHYVERIGGPPGPLTEDYAAVVDEAEVWVVESAGEVRGVLVLRPAPDHLMVDNVAVHPSQQGQGVGTQLLAFAERRAAAHGAGELRLYTHELMTENIARYERLGYRETHRAEEHGLRRVFFTKPL